jgi:hypothetical protein
MSRAAFQPVKPIDPESPKFAIRRLVDQAGGVPRAAIRIGVAPPTLYAYCDPGVSDEITFARVAALTCSATSAAAEYLAHLAGGVFLPIPAIDGTLGALTAEAMKEHAEACASIVNAMADGRIDDGERQRSIRELDEAIAALVHLRQAVQRHGKGEA